MTGIHNRRHIEEKIEDEIRTFHLEGSVFSLMLADLDLFKSINDTFGHDAGDHILKAIADDFKEAIRLHDVVARWGGEEFLILLPDTSLKQAGTLAERIRKLIQDRIYTYNSIAIKLTITIGVSTIRADDTAGDMIKRADFALYQGKHKGRNCVMMEERRDRP